MYEKGNYSLLFGIVENSTCNLSYVSSFYQRAKIIRIKVYDKETEIVKRYIKN